MANGNKRRGRFDRAVSLDLPPGMFARTCEYLRRGDVGLRIGLCLLTAVVICVATRSWAPAFAYRTGHTPQRDILANTKLPNETATEEARRKAQVGIRYVYENDPKPLV